VIIVRAVTQDMANYFFSSNFYKSPASSSGHSWWTALMQWVSNKTTFSYDDGFTSGKIIS